MALVKYLVSIYFDLRVTQDIVIVRLVILHHNSTNANVQGQHQQVENKQMSAVNPLLL